MPIGLPFGNNITYHQMCLVAFTKHQYNLENGELILGGPQVCKGYINNDTKTKESFLFSSNQSEPFDELVYLSGDIVKYSPSYGFIYLHRKDRQVKVNGYRIELGEIDYWIKKITGSMMAATIVKNVNSLDIIISYFECTDNKVTASEIADKLAKKIPDYMMPAKIVSLSSLPLNSNGKIDVTRLGGF